MSRLDPDYKNKPLCKIPVVLFLLFSGLAAYGISCSAANLEISIALLGVDEEKHIPLSLLQPVIDDSGLAGAEQGIDDNNTTGQFTGQSFKLKAKKLKVVHRTKVEDSIYSSNVDYTKQSL